MFKSLLIVAVAAFGLSACQSTGSIDTGIRNSLPQVCSAGETAYAVLQPFIVADRLKPKTTAAAQAAYQSLQSLCANRDTATLASTLVAASSAYLTISIAVSEAKKVEK
ncbi:cell wall anchor protein [Agrobacterium tumefaciens]|uniref:Cell wall anchor protein n=1 Tax=Agrobacterium tumefaciens TaxID=358 RepID=A0AAP9E307_AGRTU|nr:cell wall anchor protein [Agrobacterium tumefaciens]NSZ57754.1 cell wall anchor protein [Agrobacterium tumefaciens]QDY93873.1 cell wall anchor protein [Agrobacterium tumefaciens]UXS48945.1 cell wall anchor protein [Agrobacterium tumefaciens]UXS70249.1 cell wall anchor protein [Agrobacterium tumefaciens]UXS77912.1 cell wall anchor protein [Agrobacterium tumefaciens]